VRILSAGISVAVAAAHTYATMHGFCEPWTISVSCGICWMFGTYWEQAN
jgi:hypothetical protein